MSNIKKEMKNLSYLFIFCLFLFSCGPTEPAPDPTPDTEVETETNVNVAPPTETPESGEDEGDEDGLMPVERGISDLEGSYVGMFEAKEFHEGKNPSWSNKINIIIDKMDMDKSVKGRSVVAGNYRPFEGTWEQVKTDYVFTVKEPGDDKYDGTFNFTLNAGYEDMVMEGTWTANDKKLAVWQREYKLEPALFEYKADNQIEDLAWTDLYGTYNESTNEGEFLTEEVSKFNASTVALKKEDVENMHKGDLEVIRNAIYARHGYSFKNRKMRYLFDRYVDWYIPHSVDVRKDLTDLEKKNIDLLKRYEEHADRYYDSFGR